MSVVPVSLPALMPALIAALIGWRLYKRTRRLIGRQQVGPRRLVVTSMLWPVLLVLVALSGLRDVSLLGGEMVGVAIGIGLALWGLKLTQFEATPSGFFYRPNTWLGVAISLLFIARLAYRFGSIWLTTGSFDPQTLQSFGRSALTLAIFGVVGGYFTAYSMGVLSWYRKARAEYGAIPVIVEPPAP